ncbi:hypothetical protein WA026_004068 [Henosepilachna vigintioctopunctata]|uniref:Cation/H+ exchanger transmembrane domain-containing protein n=1 Tax=Henosepilachna vigintioctopunctata TaxID=420089 RepID=A0AAW1UDL8_9CUCU
MSVIPDMKESFSERGMDNLGFQSQIDAEKPRKKSILVKSGCHNEGAERKHSMGTGHVNIVEASSPNSLSDSQSCWHLFCSRFRKTEVENHWEPKPWQFLCPYPFCPTYRQFARLIALLLLGILTYLILYSIFEEPVAPGGKLFTLILLTICSYLAGYLVSLIMLPGLIGMLCVGLIFQNTGIVNIDDSYSEITKNLRIAALVIILIRAGLDLDPDAMKRLKLTVLKLSLGPWTIEVITIALMMHYLVDFPWWWASLMGIVVAAVAPAVVVSCIFRLRAKGYGVVKGIPTLILAASSICDSISVAIFGIVRSIMFSDESITFLLLIGTASIFGGIFIGIVYGILIKYIPESHDPFMVPLRILLLLGGGMIALFGSEYLGYGGAGPLGCVAAAFTAIYFWTKQGWDIEDNPAATAFDIFWIMCEPVLFGVTGTQLKISELSGDIVVISFGILMVGIIVRIIATIVIGSGSGLNVKEKLFVSLSLIPKATVQAALGPVTLSLVAADSIEHTYARRLLMISLLSIILATPLGALSISLTGKWLLTKTKFPEFKRGSRKFSLRDISIKGEECSDPEEDVENFPKSNDEIKPSKI